MEIMSSAFSGFAIGSLVILCVPVLVAIIIGAIFFSKFSSQKKQQESFGTPQLAADVFAKAFAQKQANDEAPQQTVYAEVIAKRTWVQGQHTFTTYYATFQQDSGQRMELIVPGREFGYLIEGDQGKLTFQGTRFVKFEREV